MEIWIALLRGINVGGRNRLPMASLRDILSTAGAKDVSTWIQSGNAIFHAEITSTNTVSANVSSLIEKAHGFAPAIRLLTADELDLAIQSNPHTDAENDPKSLHVNFLDEPPDAERLAHLRDLATVNESFEVIGRHLYLYAPDGIARSKLASGLDRALGPSATARNWRTVLKIADLANTIKQRSGSDGIQ